MQPNDWLTAAGLVTWIASGVPAALANAGGHMTGLAAAAWITAFAAFGLAFSLICLGRSRGVRVERALVLAQSIAGLVMAVIARDGLAGATLVVAAAQLPGLVPSRIAAAWVAVQTAALVVVFWWIGGRVTAFTVGGAFLGFQMFAMATST